MMKKIIIALSLLAVISTQAFAFLYEMPMLTKEEVQKLSDEDLVEKYIEAKIEAKASQEFHQAAGFNSGKEYENRKKLLRYLFELRRELSIREKIEAGSLDELLK